MRASTIPARGMTTPPTPCRRPPCTTAISRRCCAAGSQYTIYDPATRVAGPTGGRFTETPFPGNIIPTSRIRPGRREDPVVVPDDREEPGRRHRPEQLPRRHHRGESQVLQLDRPRRPEPRRPAALLRPLQHLHPQQHLQQLLRQRFRGRRSSGSTRRPRCSTTSSRCRRRMVLDTRYSYNRFIRGSDAPASRRRLRRDAARLLVAVRQPGSRRTSRASRAST